MPACIALDRGSAEPYRLASARRIPVEWAAQFGTASPGRPSSIRTFGFPEYGSPTVFMWSLSWCGYSGLSRRG